MADVITVTPESTDDSALGVATGIAIASAEQAEVTAADAEAAAEMAGSTADLALSVAGDAVATAEAVTFDIGGMEARLSGQLAEIQAEMRAAFLVVAETLDKPAEEPEPKPEPQHQDTPPKQEHPLNKRLWGNK